MEEAWRGELISVRELESISPKFTKSQKSEGPFGAGPGGARRLAWGCRKRRHISFHQMTDRPATTDDSTAMLTQTYN
eukprot:scaffold4810_cov226-Skeletonema_marinoi.AAC.3